MPNKIFTDLSHHIKDKKGRTNVQQVSFAYVYLTVICFLYRYTNFVSIDSKTYIQNGDIKQLLGYARKTKTIDHVIKKNGILDSMNLTRTTKDYPLYHSLHKEKVNGMPVIQYTTLNDDSLEIKGKTSSIVKNRNYEIKEPIFFTESFDGSEYGTYYQIENTHRINIDEILIFLLDDDLDNIDFLLYGYIKSRCKGYKDNSKQISLASIITNVGIDKVTFYKHIKKLKEKKMIDIIHKGWQIDNGEGFESNEYKWNGVN